MEALGPVRIGQAGLGNWGKNLVRNIDDLADLRWLCDASPDLQDQFAKRFPNARVTGDPVAPRKLNPKLTPVAEEIILHAMEREPKRRYQTALEMRAELDNYEAVELTVGTIGPPPV